MRDSIFTDIFNKEYLEENLKKGYKVPDIAKKMGISNGVIYRELQKTLTEEEYQNKRFVCYTAKKSLEKDNRIEGLKNKISKLKGGK